MQARWDLSPMHTGHSEEQKSAQRLGVVVKRQDCKRPAALRPETSTGAASPVHEAGEAETAHPGPGDTQRLRFWGRVGWSRRLRSSSSAPP